jgi:hypothetical protein
LILEDFVMLGTTVPEPNSDGRVFVCSAGFSDECRSLIRIYPLARRNAPKRWTVNKVPLERNPKDSRDESWQVAGDRTPGAHRWINYEFDRVREQISPSARAHLLSRHVLGSIQEANAKRRSLTIIHPEEIELHFEANPDSGSNDAPPLALFDLSVPENAEQRGARRFPWMPRLKFRDEGGWHNLMLRDWGTFELQRKHLDEENYFIDNLRDALKLGPSSSLLVGNMNNQRNSWLVISVLNGIREPETLFDSLRPEPVSVSASERMRILERDSWRCTQCGSDVDRLRIHRRSDVTGGENDRAENLLSICDTCSSQQYD